jgi:hypothetical protein
VQTRGCPVLSAPSLAYKGGASGYAASCSPQTVGRRVAQLPAGEAYGLVRQGLAGVVSILRPAYGDRGTVGVTVSWDAGQVTVPGGVRAAACAWCS